MSKIQSKHIPLQPKNAIINGAMDFSQQWESNPVTVNTATTLSAYTADMWSGTSSGPTNKSYNLIRSSDVPSLAQSGFSSIYSTVFTMTTGIVSPAATDTVNPFVYRMEGRDYAKYHGKKVTFGFWIKASVAGTYSFSMRNSNVDRCYVTTFQASANTWEFKSITVTLDNTGTWGFDTGIGVYIQIGSYGGTTFQTGTLGSWQSGNFFVASTATNYQATSGATLTLTQVSMVEGGLGVGPTGFMRAGDSLQDELSMVQRYYEKSNNIGIAPGNADSFGRYYWIASASLSGAGIVTVPFKVTKRIAPSVILWNPATGASNQIRNEGAGTNLVLTASVVGQNAFLPNYNAAENGGNPLGDQNIVSWHYTADARL